MALGLLFQASLPLLEKVSEPQILHHFDLGGVDRRVGAGRLRHGGVWNVQGGGQLGGAGNAFRECGGCGVAFGSGVGQVADGAACCGLSVGWWRSRRWRLMGLWAAC